MSEQGFECNLARELTQTPDPMKTDASTSERKEEDGWVLTIVPMIATASAK